MNGRALVARAESRVFILVRLGSHRERGALVSSDAKPSGASLKRMVDVGIELEPEPGNGHKDSLTLWSQDGHSEGPPSLRR